MSARDSLTRAPQILELPWDHSASPFSPLSPPSSARAYPQLTPHFTVVYIGNARVGRIVATAAAQHLTPVTLELGGKNPVVVDPRMDDVALTARRLLWGRFSNAGQICLAPEYVLVPAHFQDALVGALKEAYEAFYPGGAGGARESESFSRIVTEGHARRIKGMLDATGGTVVCGGETDVEKRYVAPTIVRDVKEGDSLLSECVLVPPRFS